MDKIGWQTNCAINECTGDGNHVGRCWFSLEKQGTRLICRRHGDVTTVMERYAAGEGLTSELDHDPELQEIVRRRRAPVPGM